MIVVGDDKNVSLNNVFDDFAFDKAKYFNCDDYDSAVNYVYKQIKYLFLYIMMSCSFLKV